MLDLPAHSPIKVLLHPEVLQNPALHPIKRLLDPEAFIDEEQVLEDKKLEVQQTLIALEPPETVVHTGDAAFPQEVNT